ncbi:MAG: truncated hemoglobin YjbI [Maribacter sp.]|jgi:truncated hemoglobin YjbI
MEEATDLIKDRMDVSLLVRALYVKIRKDVVLGPIFNTSITD